MLIDLAIHVGVFVVLSVAVGAGVIGIPVASLAFIGWVTVTGQ
tara:strand:+ start:237 stop:365 length:129 start_codon:yes stop_codon:yes gene_type:complete